MQLKMFFFSAIERYRARVNVKKKKKKLVTDLERIKST